MPILEVSPWFCFSLFAYCWGVTFAIVRVISMIFLKETLQAAADNQEMMISEKMRQ